MILALALAAVAAAQDNAPGKPLLYQPVARETQAAGPEFDEHDALRARLIKQGDWYSVPSAAQPVLLIVQKDYLDAAALKRFVSDVVEAVAGVPEYTGRKPPKYRGRIVFYVYDSGPMSEADVPGVRKDERGVMMRFVKEDEAPVFHELAHLLAGYSDSQSLAEGFAEEVESHFRPGKAHAFTPADADPDALAKASVARYPKPYFEAIGAPGYSNWSGEEIRHEYYFASWSFARWLIRCKDMKAFLRVLDGGGKDDAYASAYGEGLAALRADWRAYLESRP